MRMEVKAGIVIGLVVIVGAVIWSVNNSGERGGQVTEIPFSMNLDDAVGSNDLDLAGDEEVAATPPGSLDPVGSGDVDPPGKAADDMGLAGLTGGFDGAGGDPDIANTPIGGFTEPLDGGKPEDVLTPRDSNSETTGGDPGADPRDALRELTRVPTGNTTYTIRDGDTFIALAIEFYGDERYWLAIQAANPGVDPKRLQEGQVIAMPPKDKVLSGAFKPATPTKTEKPAVKAGRAEYVVEDNDSLSSIARNVLGDSSRWDEIFELNRHQLESPDEIFAGMKLKMPPISAKPKTETKKDNP
jgi:nucleoid-associated protein YgaU